MQRPTRLEWMLCVWALCLALLWVAEQPPEVQTEAILPPPPAEHWEVNSLPAAPARRDDESEFTRQRTASRAWLRDVNIYQSLLAWQAEPGRRSPAWGWRLETPGWLTQSRLNC